VGDRDEETFLKNNG